jgi:hypothetical protein
MPFEVQNKYTDNIITDISKGNKKVSNRITSNGKTPLNLVKASKKIFITNKLKFKLRQNGTRFPVLSSP